MNKNGGGPLPFDCLENGVLAEGPLRGGKNPDNGPGKVDCDHPNPPILPTPAVIAAIAAMGFHLAATGN